MENMAIWGYLQYTKSFLIAGKVFKTHSENTRKEFMRPWRRRKETLGVFSLYAKRYKSVYISVNNNTNLNLFKILSNYIIWNRLSQKTISRYCPFKAEVPICVFAKTSPIHLAIASENGNSFYTKMTL